jgi:hypothetical protein
VDTVPGDDVPDADYDEDDVTRDKTMPWTKPIYTT